MEYNTLVGFKRDIKYKPFLSFTTLRIIGLIVFGITQLVLALYLVAFTFVIPLDKLTDETVYSLFDLILSLFAEGEVISSLSMYKDLLSIWPFIKAVYSISRLVSPILILGLFGRLIQKPNNIKSIFIRYLIMTLLVFLVEIGFYYLTYDNLLDYLVEAENVDPKIVGMIQNLSKNAMLFYANLNMFLDLLISIIFFKFFISMPKIKYFQKHIKVYRSFSIFPILYIILSTIILGFEKKGIIQFPLIFNSLLSARGIYVYILFFPMCIYFKIRFRKCGNKVNYIQEMQKSNLEMFNFVVFSCLVLLVISLVSKLTLLWSDAIAFRLDFGTLYFYLIPIVLFYDFTIKPRFKYMIIFYGLYYALIGAFLFAGYVYIFDYIIELLKIVSNTIGMFFA